MESSNNSLQYMADALHRSGDKKLHHTKETHRLRQTEAVEQTRKSLASALISKTSHNEAELSKDIINEVREKAFHE